MSRELYDQLFKWAATTNLNHVIKFHNEARLLFKGVYQSLGSPKDDSDIETKALRDTYFQFDGLLHINTFLMLHSYLEEWLFHLCKAVQPPPDRNKSGIERFKPSFQALGADLSAGNWLFLKDAEKVRNCLLHANGRVSLSKNSTEMEKIAQKYPKELSIVQDRLVVHADFLQRFSSETEAFLNHMRSLPNPSFQGTAFGGP